jgi:hypothetical protein
MASDWNRFTSKIFKEGRTKHGKSYSFKQALQDASDRKGEMKTMGPAAAATDFKKSKKSKKSRKSMQKSKKSKGKTRKNHKNHKNHKN